MSLYRDPEGFKSVLVHGLGTGICGDSLDMGQTPVGANPSHALPSQEHVRSPRDCISEEKRSPATNAGLSLPCTQLGHSMTVTSPPPSPCWTPPLASTQTSPQGRVICPWQGFPAGFVQDQAPREGTSYQGRCHPLQLHKRRTQQGKLGTPRPPQGSAHHEP